MKQTSFFAVLLFIGLTAFVSCSKKEEVVDNSSKDDVTTTGIFSVGAVKKVIFASGNLQYHAKTNTWRFADHQYDIVGNANSSVSPTYNGYIDLFGWGTSGYNGKYPYMTSDKEEDYGDGNKDIAGTNYDWGIYNPINNAENKAGIWRTLTKSEWTYLFEDREKAELLRGQATVNNMYGYIILPDNWDNSVMRFTSSPNNWTTNVYTSSEWEKMEKAGAVFLPAAGVREGEKVSDIGLTGVYWSSSCGGDIDGKRAGHIDFSERSYRIRTESRWCAFAVRLVKDVDTK